MLADLTFQAMPTVRVNHGTNTPGTGGFLRTQKRRYASASDFAQVFSGEMPSLFLLALSLTADPVSAEKCFVSGLEECVNRMDIFLDRASAWARRAIVKQAIRLIGPIVACEAGRPSHLTNSATRQIYPWSALGTFERFVFVMSVIERQADHDCALLLGCQRRDVKSARELAISNLR